MPRPPKLLYLALFALVALTYANHFGNGFHFDDMHTVVDNPYVRDLHNWKKFFQDASTFSVLPANRTWRPLVSLSLALDYSLGRGYVPFWFHLSTFILFLVQLAAMLALFDALLGRASPEAGARNRWISIFAVAWYGLHPAIAETVNYVIQRGDIFAALGVIAALALYACSPRARKYQLYLLPFAFGLMSKPPALVFPVLLFVQLALFGEEGPRRVARALLKTVPAWIAGALLLWLQALHTPKSYAPSILSPSAYRMVQPYVWLRYLGSWFLPIHLSVDSDLQPLPPGDIRVICGFLFALMLIAAAIWTARRAGTRPISYGLWWFLIAQLPTSLYALSEVENDHRMYLSFAGLALAVSCALALGISKLLSARRISPIWIGSLAATLLLAYARGTYARNQVWRSEETLWADCAGKSPANGRGLMNYGLVLMGSGRYQQALELFTRALTYTPNYSYLEINLGIDNDALGRPVDAERHFQRALQLAPQSDQGHYYYARWLFARGRTGEARREAEQAVALSPARLDANHLLIQIEQARGELEAARATATATLALDPGDALAKAALANAAGTPAPPAQSAGYYLELSLREYQQKSYADSLVSARRALALDPVSAEAWNNIAAASAELGRWDDAIDAAEHALTLKPDFALAKNNLAWAESAKAAAAKR